MRLTLNTDDLAERDRVPFWHDAICQEIFHVTPAQPIDDPGFHAKLDVQTAGRFTLVELESSHGSIEKTAGDLSRGAGNDMMLYLAVERSRHYQHDSYEYLMAPGDVCIVPMDQRFHCVAGNVPFRSLLIPDAVLRPLMAGGELAQAQLLRAGTPFAALLGGSLNAAASQIPLLSGEMGDAVLSNLSGLVALACAPSDEGREAGRAGLRTARLDAVKRHVDRHLSRPLLDPASVAKALGISVRQLHLLFEPTGDSFARYLLRRRLECCRRTLANPNAIGRSVADVAFAWGFNSLSVFYRTFAAQFGMSPGSVREAAAARSDLGAPR